MQHTIFVDFLVFFLSLICEKQCYVLKLGRWDAGGGATKMLQNYIFFFIVVKNILISHKQIITNRYNFIKAMTDRVGRAMAY